jgi:hypothetical protein
VLTTSGALHWPSLAREAFEGSQAAIERVVEYRSGTCGLGGRIEDIGTRGVETRVADMLADDNPTRQGTS